MSIKCKACDAKLSEEEYGGEISPDTLCPHCGEILKRNISIHLKAAEMKLTGGIVNLTVRTYPEGLLEEVADLIERKKFTLAVVVSQMACEISVERALSAAFGDDKVQHLAETVMKMLSGRSITNGKVRELYDALTGKDTLTDLQKLKIWDGLVDLGKWRNAAVHRGKICVEEEANVALNVSSKLVKYLKPI